MEYGKKMSGWGRISLLIGAGILLGAGCGGRTGALDGDFDGGAEAGRVSQGGSNSVAGRSSRGGRGNVAGSVGVAGTYSPGGSYGIAGVGSYPMTGGYGGAYAFGGSYAFGGTYPGGGYGGYIPVAGYGGYYPVAGFGGYYPGGGFAGQGPEECGQCLRAACSPQLSRCLQDFGCIAILSCVQSRGCEPFECYSEQYCRGTIDQWGGPAGQSMSSLLQTFSCAVQAGCPCD